MDEPAYSVIIPAYNEESLLPGTLAALREAMASVPLTGEVIVVDNNCTDVTPRIARKAGARVVFEPINQISRARNAGAREARGRYFVFVDADTLVSPALLRTALRNLSRGDCCGGGTLVDFGEEVAPHVQRAVETWNRLATAVGLAAGCFVYCLREGFQAVGGFSQRVYASEEIWFSRGLSHWGRRRRLAFRVITEHRAATSSRKMQWFSPLRMTGMMLVMLLFPFAVYFRPLCSMWYTRPQD